MKSLPKIADELLDGLADEMAVDEYDLVAGRGAPQQVSYAYCHGSCDVFAQALHDVTGWMVASVTHPSAGLLHRLLVSPDGRLLDAEGFQDEAALAKRYGKKRGIEISLVENPGAFFSAGDDEVQTALEAAIQLPWAPFNTPEMQSKLRSGLGALSKAPESHEEGAPAPTL